MHHECVCLKRNTSAFRVFKTNCRKINEREKTFSVKGLQFLIDSCVIQMLLLNEGLVHHAVVSSCVFGGDNNNVMSETDDQKSKESVSQW